MTVAPSYPADNAPMAIDLNHGVGLQAFALVASSESLPDFRTWLAEQGEPPWRAAIAADPGIVWRDDGSRIEVLSQAAIRGTGSAARGASGAVAELSKWLKSRPGVSLVYLKAFGVQANNR